MNEIENMNKTSIEAINNVLLHLFETPIFSVNDIVSWVGYTERGAYKLIDKMLTAKQIVPYTMDSAERGQKWISTEYQTQLIADAGKTNPDTINLVTTSYDHDGTSTKTNNLGMREMQARAYEKRTSKKLLIKAPPASGKSRALMFFALDKLYHQGVKKVVIAVPERAIGASFGDTELTAYGFFADWHIDDRNNLCTEDGLDDCSKVGAFVRFMNGDDQILLCTHATLRFAFEEIPVEKFNNCVLAIDEFHHASIDQNSRLGQLLHDVMAGSNVQIIAMTGSYFRGDTVPILTPEDEDEFDKVTYTYYEQLNGYTYLKTLGIGYNFYNGNYLDRGALDKILDTRKKTIVHIPNVNSRESTQIGKNQEVDTIYDIIGEWIKTDPETKVDYLRTTDGRIVKVANLVNDEPEHRLPLVKYLSEVARNDLAGIDIIIALGMAKEGFDWPYCEHALTVGYRSSLTEIVQIIGRCTRDSYNKTHAQFTNLIAQPNGTNDEVVIAVNSMLKAITVSLLMEQVLAPSFTFTPRPREPREARPGEIFVKGMKQAKSEKVRRILESDLEDLTASALQNPHIQKAAASNAPGEHLKFLESQIIREHYPGLTEEEVETTRQYLAANIASKTAKPVKDKDGNIKFLRMANHFIKIEDLDINLIDSINPFYNAFEVMSKKLNTDLFRQVRDYIRGSQINMTVDEALKVVPKIKQFVQTYSKNPSINSNDENEKYLAMVQAFLTKEHAKYNTEKARRAEETTIKEEV